LSAFLEKAGTSLAPLTALSYNGKPVRKPVDRKGVLFVFEGIDGTGKTTQALRLVEELGRAGHDVVYFREPSDSKWGRIIREKAVEEDSLTPIEELELFQNDRRENVEKNLKPAIDGGKIVVLDRYYYSTMAYQGAKGISSEKIRKDNEDFAPPPDLIFVFDLNPAAGLERISDRGRRDILFEREDYLDKVRAVFLGLKGERFIHVDASQPVETVAARIKKVVSRYLSCLD